MTIELDARQRRADRRLSELDAAERDIDMCLAMVERAESMGSKVTAVVDGLGITGSAGDRLGDAVAMMDEAVDKLCAVVSERTTRVIDDVSTTVMRVMRRDADAGHLLRLVYVDRLSVAEAAESMGCSRKAAYARLRSALDIACDEMEDNR